MHSLFRTFSFLTLAAAVSARAQMTPPAEPAEHEAVNLDYMVVTAMPFVRNQAEIAAATAVLEGRSLQVRRQGTLGETLAGEVGMASTSFGPGAGRPIIRGLGGDRIRILENGVGTIDASVTSPDHAVSVEPFLVERIEIVRGPASLLYGSSAVGGVVNVITHRIETAIPERRVSGAAELRYGSGANETGFGGVTDIAVHRSDRGALVLHLDGFKRNAGDLEIPGYAESARLRAEEAAEAAEQGEEAPEEVAGILPNSSVDSSGGAAGLSWVSPGLSVGFAYTGFNTFFGIPGGAHAHEHEEGDAPAGESEGEEEHGEEDVRIDLRQRRVDLQGEWRHQTGLVRALRFKLGRAEYRHQELEGEAIGTVFRNQGYDGRIEYRTDQ